VLRLERRSPENALIEAGKGAGEIYEGIGLGVTRVDSFEVELVVAEFLVRTQEDG
jgi:hypothetical protein